ncbi:Alginate lyase [Paenibacillus sp. 1_12]|uniref:heparinase II/III domain-containing protein n=1 Tax=Paenibacillus sp. 1_12 TaxID=1566278 RepID=UPI0008F3AC0D|nr:heparinase II/III family protein [Paenibacillus sp. 1_12]SFL48951.1 Alginate lyase [Paenibacillus sp. 1_12]
MRIEEKLQSTLWANETLQKLKEELDALLSSDSLHIPKEPGGWWHQYVCPEHHIELLFDPNEQDAYSFHCPHGCRIEGDAYRGAWLVFKHQSMARCALQAAAIYAGIKDQSYAELAKRIIVNYAAQFPQYPVHPDAQPWMLKGRAFHQALTEAIWSTTLLRAYLLLQDEGVRFNEEEKATLDIFLSMLEESMVQYRQILIHDRQNPENNYTAWLNASLSCVYAVRGQQELLQGLIDGEGGWKHHLAIGVKPDQFEFEGSTYYHIFVLRAYLISAEMAERFGVDLYPVQAEQGQSMRGMFDVLVGLADDQGVLPALHDGPLARVPFAREIAEILEIGLVHYGNELYAPLLGEAYRQMDGEARRISLEALVYGEGDANLADTGLLSGRSTLLLKDSGFVVGRKAGNSLSFLADFGPHGGSHGHYDKLHVTIQHEEGTFTPDLGVVPYGSSLRKSWFAETVSHNTVSIGGQSQAEHTGRCKLFTESEQAVYVWLQSDEAYEGCILNRHLLLSGDWLLDWFEVQLVEEQTIDWWMHPLIKPNAADGAWVRESGTVDGNGGLGFVDHGYGLVKITDYYETEEGESLGLEGQLDKLKAPKMLTLRYVPDNDTTKWLHQSILAFPGTSLLRVETPGTSVDPSLPLNGLLQRQTGKRASFVQIYKVGPAAQANWEARSEDNSEASNGQLVISTQSQEAVCVLDPEQGLIVTWRDKHE